MNDPEIPGKTSAQIANAAEKKITKAPGLTISPGGSPVNKNASKAATSASR